jgi:hypothetical protein
LRFGLGKDSFPVPAPVNTRPVPYIETINDH